MFAADPWEGLFRWRKKARRHGYPGGERFVITPQDGRESHVSWRVSLPNFHPRLSLMRNVRVPKTNQAILFKSLHDRSNVVPHHLGIGRCFFIA